MIYPKIASVKITNDHILIVKFDNKQKRKYDVKPLLDTVMFLPLKNVALFRSVKVDTGGYAIVWNEDIDISEYELWQHGQVIQ